MAFSPLSSGVTSMVKVGKSNSGSGIHKGTSIIYGSHQGVWSLGGISDWASPLVRASSGSCGKEILALGLTSKG